jgi:hypothetical protein
MTAKLRSRFSYANVVSTLALFLVIAGGVALGRAETQQGGPTLQHQLKVVKGLVKEVEADQQASSQQSQGTLSQMQGKLDGVHNAVIDAHVQLGSRLDEVRNRLRDVVEPRLLAICQGEDSLGFASLLTHDGPSTTEELFNSANWGPKWDACRLALNPPD